MMDQQVVGAADVDELAVVARLRLEAVIGGLDEDLGVVAGAAQDTLNAEHFVADRVAVPERCEHLMDADHAVPAVTAAALGAPPPATAGPLGTDASVSRAGGTSSRCRSSQPGRSTPAPFGGSPRRRSNISRYLFSMTGQS